jgi:hypothetical protein
VKREKPSTIPALQVERYAPIGSIYVSGQGKVGIGIGNPVALLDIAGSIRINGGTEISMIQGETTYLAPSWYQQRMTAVISFPKPFPVKPKIVANVRIPGAKGVLVSNVLTGTNTSFEISLYMMMEAYTSPSFTFPIQVDWLAWTTTSYPQGIPSSTGYPLGGFAYDFIGIGGHLI